MEALRPLSIACLCAALIAPSEAIAKASPRAGDAAATRSRASQRLTKLSTAAASSASFASRTIEAAGQKLQIFERRNSRGAVTGQTILSSRFQAFWVDADGDGRMEHWEASDGRGTVSLRGPTRSRFLFMNVEQSRRDGRVQMQFIYNEASSDYVLYEARRVPHKALSANQDFIVGCQGTDEDRRLRDLAVQLNQKLKEGGGEALLRQEIEQRVNEGCSDPAFEASREQIIKGLLAVAGSDSFFTSATIRRSEQQKSGRYAKTGLYLQCLRDFNMDVLASRIQAGFADMLSSDAARDLRPWNLECRESANGREHGQYESRPPTIRLFDTRDSVARTLGLGPGDVDGVLESQYASISFHEALHYAFVDDERIVHKIQGCCGTNASSESAECNELRDLVSWKEMGQRFEAQVAAAMPDGYGLMRDGLRQAFGPRADQMIEDFYLEIGKSYQQYRTKPECHADGSSATVLGSCEEAFRDGLRAGMQSFFGSGSGSGSDSGGQCVEQATSAFANAENARKFCGSFHLLAGRLLDVDVNSAAGSAVCRKSVALVVPPWLPAPVGGFAVLNALGIVQGANADIDDATANICSLVAKAKPIELNFSPTSSEGPVAPVGLFSVAPIAGQAQGAKSVGQAATVSASAPTQTAFPSSLGSSSPGRQPGGFSRPLLARDPASATLRQEQFERYLSGSGRALEGTRTLAEAISRTLVPEAGAGTRGLASDSLPARRREQQGRGSRATDGPASAGSSSPDFSLYAANLPRLHIANPLAPVRSLASVGGAASASPSAPSAAAGTQRAEEAGAARPAAGSGSGSGLPSAPGAAKTAPGAWASGPGSSRLPPPPSEEPGPAERARSNQQRREAFQSLLRMLVGPYETVKPQLGKSNLSTALREFGVQVTDDEEQVYGAARPSCIVRYDRTAGRLARGSQCRVRDP